MKKKLVLVEWDGDRSGDAGGFNIELGTTLKYDGPSYNTDPERKSCLESMRKKLKSLTEELGCECEEKIFKS